MIENRHISWASLWRIVTIIGIIGICYYSRSVLSIIFFAIIIFAAFDPVVDWFDRKKLSRILGTIFVYVSMVVVATIIFLIIAPVVYKEAIGAVDLIPGYSEKALNMLVGSKFGQSLNEVIFNYSDSILKSGSTVISTLLGLVGSLTAAISVLLISFYLLVRQNSVESLIRAVLPKGLEHSALKIWRNSRVRVGRWFRTQLVLSIVVGFLVYFSLLILGVKYALILGLIAAVLEIIPIVGPIFSAVISALVAFPQSIALAIWVLAIFVVIQQIESNILVPLTMKKSVGLNPVMVIIAILIGAELGGIMGIIFAIPVMVIFEEIMEESNRRKEGNSPI